MTLDAWFNGPVSKADETWVAEAEATDIDPDSSELVEPDGNAREVGATFCPAVDSPRLGIKAAGFVDAAEFSWESGFENVSARTEVDRAAFGPLPDIE